jgi:alkaline phosphatase D
MNETNATRERDQRLDFAKCGKSGRMAAKTGKSEEEGVGDAYPKSSARRRWLTSVAASGAGTLAQPAAALFSRSLLAFPPAAFDITSGRALVGVIGNREAKVHARWSVIDVKASATSEFMNKSDVVELTADANFANAVELDKLPDGANVRYALFAGDERISDVQQFRAAPHDRSRRDFSFAFSGDIEERYKPFRIFDSIAAQKVDAFLHLGDTVYADVPKRDFSPTIAHYRRKHAAIRTDRSLQTFMSNHAMIAIWDDHEIENDANGSHPAIADAEQVFREFWPVREQTQRVASRANNDRLPHVRFHRRAGLYRHLSFGEDIDLFVLDTRRFRSPQSDANDEKKTMLGSEQLTWFRNAYRSSSARYRLVATSVPFHGSSKDAWGNYEHERDQLLAMFREANAANDVKTVLLSADYHFAREWPRNERRGIYEFMAGPLAAFLTFEKDNSAKQRHTRGEHFVFGERANFGVLRYEAKSGALRIEYFDDAGTRLHTRTI